MSILPNEYRAISQRFEEIEGLPKGLHQALIEEKTGWRPNTPMFPDIMPSIDSEDDIVTQSALAAEGLKSNLQRFGGNAPIAALATIKGVDSVEHSLANGFKQDDIDTLYKIGYRASKLTDMPFAEEQKAFLEKNYGKPTAKVANVTKSKAPDPMRPLTIRANDSGRWYTGDPTTDAIIYIESRGKPDAVSNTGAKGVFQFTGGTGKGYGLVGKGFDKRSDPQESLKAFQKLTKDNSNYLKKNGVPVNAYTIYLAHQQGMGGAVEIWNAAQGKGELSKTVRKNMGHNWGANNSAQEYVAITKRKVDEAMAAVGHKGEVGSTPIVTAPAMQAEVKQDSPQAYQPQVQAEQQAATLPKSIDVEPVQQQSISANQASGANPRSTDIDTGPFIKSELDTSLGKTDWKALANKVFGQQLPNELAPKSVSSAIKGVVKNVVG